MGNQGEAASFIQGTPSRNKPTAKLPWFPQVKWGHGGEPKVACVLEASDSYEKKKPTWEASFAEERVHTCSVLQWNVDRGYCSLVSEKTEGLVAIMFPAAMAACYCWLFAVDMDGAGVTGPAWRRQIPR